MQAAPPAQISNPIPRQSPIVQLNRNTTPVVSQEFYIQHLTTMPVLTRITYQAPTLAPQIKQSLITNQILITQLAYRMGAATSLNRVTINQFAQQATQNQFFQQVRIAQYLQNTQLLMQQRSPVDPLATML